MVYLVHLALLDLGDQEVKEASLALQVHLDHLVLLDSLALVALMDDLDLQVP